MKQLWRIACQGIAYCVFISISLVTASISPFGGKTGINTKQVDRHIEKLKQSPWFTDLYDRYRPLFFGNRKVRGYLESSIRVERIRNNEYARKKFIMFLDRHVEARAAGSINRKGV